MAKKKNDQNILLMTDSASDIADSDLLDGGIVMLPIPITIDSTGYLERVDFTTTEFYERMAGAKELPVTSHISSLTYARAYLDAFESGYTDIINTTITSVGSHMFEAAVLGKRQFFEEHPGAAGRINITVLDSGTYTAGYGYPIVEASKMVKNGASADEIVAYLDDFYATVEIVFASYSLEYAKRSGRIPVAAAFIGDVLGLRPIISIIDGVTKVVEKVRGDKNVVTHIVDYAYTRAADKKSPTVVICGSVGQYGDDLHKAVSKKFGHAPRARYQAGASIAINSGPKVVAMLVRGEKRINTRAREQDF